MEITKYLERHGFLIFFSSLLITTQLRWAEIFNYSDIGLRISGALLLAAVLNCSLLIIFKKLLIKKNKEKWNNQIKYISFSLSFSFLWPAFHNDSEYVVIALILFIIYFIKSNEKARAWLGRIMNTKTYEVELKEKGTGHMLIILGKHDPDNLLAFQHLCVDLAEVFFQLKKQNVTEVGLEVNVDKQGIKEIFPIINVLGKSQDIKIICV